MDCQTHYLKLVEIEWKSKRYLTKDKTKGVYESKWQLVVPLNVDSMKNGEML